MKELLFGIRNSLPPSLRSGQQDANQLLVYFLENFETSYPHLATHFTFQGNYCLKCKSCGVESKSTFREVSLSVNPPSDQDEISLEELLVNYAKGTDVDFRCTFTRGCKGLKAVKIIQVFHYPDIMFVTIGRSIYCLLYTSPSPRDA